MVRRRGNKNTCSMSAEYDCDACMFEQSHRVQYNCSAGLFSVQSEDMMAVLLRMDACMADRTKQENARWEQQDARREEEDARREEEDARRKQLDVRIEQLHDHLARMDNLVSRNAIEELREQLQNVSGSLSRSMYALLTGRN